MAEWRRSSYSGCNGNCLEWAFRKSSRCDQLHCAEVASRGGAVLVRDSKDPGPELKFSPAAWEAFLRQVKYIKVAE